MIAQGRVERVRRASLDVSIPSLPIGSGVRIDGERGPIFGRVVSVSTAGSVVATHGLLDGIACGARVSEDPNAHRRTLGATMLGRILDAGEDGGAGGLMRPIYASGPLPNRRTAIEQPMWTGIKVIDALFTVGRVARVGIFGGPGLGKSTLVEAIVDGTEADALVVGLIGERGREAQRWMQRSDRRTTLVVATSDRSAHERVRAAHISFAQARALADRGLHVLLILDSLARFASAQRELALAGGESVGRAGFPPSVFGEIAALVERAGSFERGSITLVATVLSDGDERDPVSEAARSLLDGHFQLAPPLAQAGLFPAIDLLASSSRTMDGVVSRIHANAARQVRGAAALIERTRDARLLGIAPADAATLRAVAGEGAIESLVRQGPAPVTHRRTLASLFETADTVGEPHEHRV